MTAEELFALVPDTGIDRWLLSGKLVELWHGFHSPAHAATVATVSMLLHQMSRRGQGVAHRVLGPGCPFQLAHDPDTVVTFDTTVIESHRLTKRMDTHLDGWPLLAVVVKDLDEDEDLAMQVIEESLKKGVPSVWAIDPFEETVVWHRAGMRPIYINGGMELCAGTHLPAFRFPVAEIFE